jgi:hypothetical protein
MLKTPEAKKKRIVIISATLISILIIIYVSFSRSKSCNASDFMPRSPINTTATGFTKESACKKALATCSLYSTWPKNCKIKE